MSVVTDMSKAVKKIAEEIRTRRLIESRIASANAGAKQEGKYLKRARKRLNNRRNFHAKFPKGGEIPGHEHKAPGSMKK